MGAATKTPPQKGSRVPRKVKTGCLTCKARRVKCDEARPVCCRCRSTGRVCEGYGIWGGGGNTYAERYAQKSPELRSPSTSPGPSQALSVTEVRYIQLFRLRAIHTLSGWFGHGFWLNVVLPATASEPCILHGVIALSAAHRCNFDPTQGPDSRERFMLQQYGKALGHFKASLTHHDRASTMVVLIASQIFAFLDYLRGKHQVAEAHLRHGLRLLAETLQKETPQDKGSAPYGIQLVKPKKDTIVEKGIIQIFAGMHVQASLFNADLEDVNVLFHPLENDVPTPTFTSCNEAKLSLDKLLHGTVLLNRRFEEFGTSGVGEWTKLVAGQKETLRLIIKWRETLFRTTSIIGIRRLPVKLPGQDILAFGSRSLSDRPPTRDPMAYRLLLNYHSMAYIMASTMHSSVETKYAAHIDDFIEILSGCIEIYIAYMIARAIPGNVELSDSISEFGWIPPTYYTAMKCRNRRVRLHAIRMLAVGTWKEVAFDSMLASKVAEKVMELEERGLPMTPQDACETEFALDDFPDRNTTFGDDIPAENMFHDVQVQRIEDVVCAATITAKRWRMDGSLEVVKAHFDGKTWTDL